LISNTGNDIHHCPDFVTVLFKLNNRLGGLFYFIGQLFRLFDVIAYQPTAFTSELFTLLRRTGGFLGIVCNFPNRCGHFIHSRGDLVGFTLLFGNDSGVLLGDR